MLQQPAAVAGVKEGAGTDVGTVGPEAEPARDLARDIG